MNSYWPILQQSPLFQGMTQTEFAHLANCFSLQERSYDKNDIIFLAGQKINNLGIVLSGSVHIIQENFWGDRAILTDVTAGELFGEAFVAAELEHIPLSVVAAKASTILLVDYQRILHTCANTCHHHTLIIHNMMRILAVKNIQLTRKMSHLTQGTTAKKVLAYLSARAQEAESNAFTIPFNRQELADYLSVDRSALSRELSKMQHEGLLDYHRNRFELKK